MELFVRPENVSEWVQGETRMSAPHLPGRESHCYGRHVILVGGHVAPVIELNSQLLDHPIAHGAKKTQCNQDQVGIHRELRAGNRFELWGRANPYGVQLLNVA